MSLTPQHGGRLLQASQQYRRAPSKWLDLSTGINPHGWPVPHIDAASWQRLPDPDDGLLAAAQHYYQTPELLATAGSQAAIQALPRLRAKSQVGLPTIGYAEHRYHWQQAGHQLNLLDRDQIDATLDRLDVLVLINPNNPTGERYSIDQLLGWQQRLARRGGWLIVDEAFIDARPEQSLIQHCPRKGLIVLRSVGKFFGLAGIRAGFVAADSDLLQRLESWLGPWALTGPTRQICQLALLDSAWQQQTRIRLAADQQRLKALLKKHINGTSVQSIHGCELFQTLQRPDAVELHRRFAEQGVLLRLFESEQLLRLGLPGSEQQWQRLSRAVDSITPNIIPIAPNLSATRT